MEPGSGSPNRILKPRVGIWELRIEVHFVPIFRINICTFSLNVKLNVVKTHIEKYIPLSHSLAPSRTCYAVIFIVTLIQTVMLD